MQSTIGFAGHHGARLMRARGVNINWKIRNLPNLLRAWRVIFAAALAIPTWYGKVYARVRRADGSMINYGLISARVVTTAFVTFMVDQLQTETSTWGDFKYHDCGIGTGNEAVGDEGLGTPYGGARTAGTQTETSATVYKSVGTIAFTSDKAITEHGLFNASSNGTLMDRSKFAAINVANGDSIEFTYELTCTAGG